MREDVASAYRKEAEWQASNMLLPFKKMCAQRQVGLHNCLSMPFAVNITHESNSIFTLFDEQVEAEAVLLESDDAGRS